MKDLIERQMAIDAIGKTADELYKNIKKGATFPQRQWFDGMAHAQSILENLPSAQPEIIHCRECQYWEREKPFATSGLCFIWECANRKGSDYCSEARKVSK